MGDQLHSRNTAAALLFLRELCSWSFAGSGGEKRVSTPSRPWSTTSTSSFGSLWRVGKATADGARDIEASSVVTAMAFNCRGFALRVSGLGDTWFKGPHASVEAKLFEGHSEDEITWMGGESIIAETIGLGNRAGIGPFPAKLSGRLLRDDDRPQ